ncbi:hypothetical protein EJB05_13788, partial [Eragrostis curvula]
MSSFSLFHLLRRRFFGFTCGESSQLKTHDFVFKGLLAKNEDGTIDYNRVFRVIDVELAFMYDFFFTKYALLYYGSKASTSLSLAVASLVFATAYTVPKPKFYINQEVDVVVNKTIPRATIVVTVMILGSIGVLVGTTFALLDDHLGQSNLCLSIYPRTSSEFKEKLLLHEIGVFASNKHYYRDKLGQYSLVESVMSYHPSPPVADRKIDICCKFLDSFPFIIACTSMHGGSAIGGLENPSRCPQRKQALMQSLERTDGILTNGKSSLVLMEHTTWSGLAGMKCTQSWGEDAP